MSSSSAPDSPDVAPPAYHELSKHRPNAYAPGPATLDWDAQPNPFRHFTGAPRIELPLTAGQVRMPYSALLAGRAPPANLNGPSIGALLELGLGISTWKSNGVDRWAVRCNPSSGNLHPVEAYLTLPRTELGPAGLYHYEALGHGLELRCAFDPGLAELPPPADLRNTMPHQQWHGVANRLEPHHLYRWDAVDAMARNCVTSRQGPPPAAPGLPTSPPPPSDPPVIEVILQRRSTRAFDPRQAVSAECFYRLLSYCRPRPGLPPWDRRQAALRLHLLLFVHRVEGLPSGLYFLAEHPDAVPELRTRSRPELAWEPAPGCPSDLSCYRLLTANARKAARHLACHQQICADSAFALAMLADLDAAIAREPGGYDRLLREAGRTGQVLYIAARAEDLGASGIGCFFDDPIRELIGPADLPLQPLYMFTVGPAKPELGLIDEPPYVHRRSRSR